MSEEDDDNNSNKHSKPVTVIVKRIAKKDRIKEFEEWLSGISKEVSRQEGSMGIDIIRPTSNSSYHFIKSFSIDTVYVSSCEHGHKVNEGDSLTWLIYLISY